MCHYFELIKQVLRGGGARLRGLLLFAVAPWVIRGGGNMPSVLNPKNAKLSMEPTLKYLPLYEAEFLVCDQQNLFATPSGSGRLASPRRTLLALVGGRCAMAK